MIEIPEKCRFIFEILEANGYECFAVGGCVRDSIMNIKPSDWDFTTNASPDDIIRCFSEYKTIETGKKYGTITVISCGESFEITTYRIDGEYSDSRHPDSVLFSTSVAEDLKRRDFTINSMAYSPESGLVDPFGGLADIENGIIRCTGNAKRRFAEDALRILRALRFSAKFRFIIEDKTKNAIFEYMQNLSMVHPNRLRKEFIGILKEKPFDVLIEYRDVIAVIIPEIKPMFDLPQNNPHHMYDVWTHTVVALCNSCSDETLLLAVFFHDIGKPMVKTTDKYGVDHFKKHQIYSEEIALNVMQRFCFSNSVISDVCLLVRCHDERFRNLRTDIKRILSIISKRLFSDLLSVSYADIMAQSEYKREEKIAHRENVLIEAKKIIDADECYTLARLAVNGNDLIKMGYKGKDVGKILNALLDMVIDGIVDNNKESLLNIIPSIPLLS